MEVTTDNSIRFNVNYIIMDETFKCRDVKLKDNFTNIIVKSSYPDISLEEVKNNLSEIGVSIIDTKILHYNLDKKKKSIVLVMELIVNGLTEENSRESNANEPICPLSPSSFENLIDIIYTMFDESNKILISTEDNETVMVGVNMKHNNESEFYKSYSLMFKQYNVVDVKHIDIPEEKTLLLGFLIKF